VGRERSMTYLKFEAVPRPSANVLAQPEVHKRPLRSQAMIYSRADSRMTPRVVRASDLASIDSRGRRPSGEERKLK
jgi:hypothetical protein